MIWKWRNILKIKWIQYISSSKPLINPTRTSFTNLSEKNYIKHFFYKFLYGFDYCKCRNVITEFSVRHFPILFRLLFHVFCLDTTKMKLVCMIDGLLVIHNYRTGKMSYPYLLELLRNNNTMVQIVGYML